MFEGDSADTCAGEFLLVSMGGRAEGLAFADLGTRTTNGAREIPYYIRLVTRLSAGSKPGQLVSSHACLTRSMPANYQTHLSGPRHARWVQGMPAGSEACLVGFKNACLVPCMPAGSQARMPAGSQACMPVGSQACMPAG